MKKHKKIINHISNLREIEVARRMEHIISLNRKGIRKPDAKAKAIGKKVSIYTKILNDIDKLI